MKKHRSMQKANNSFCNNGDYFIFTAAIGLYKSGIYRFDFLKDLYRKIDFQLSTNELNIPTDLFIFCL